MESKAFGTVRPNRVSSQVAEQIKNSILEGRLKPGDKLPADKKGPIEDSLKVLKEAHKNQDMDAIDKAMTDLNSKWQAASEEMYKASQEQAAGADQGATQDPGSSKKEDSSKGDDEVTDVDFEEVK